MNRNKVIALLAIGAAISFFIWFSTSPKTAVPSSPVAKKPKKSWADASSLPSAKVQKTPTTTPSVPASKPAHSPEIPQPLQKGPYQGLTDPRWAEVKRREKLDPNWQGKLPIEFYGKVVDEKSQPVSGATVKFSWTDLSQAGSTQSVTVSDAQGLFSLKGVRGKHLGVEVEKEGYDVSRAQNRYSYDYATFWDAQSWYEPDPDNPVIFSLRKKRQGEPMIYREQEINLAVGTAALAALDKNARLQVELLSNEHGKWAARLSLNEGGLQPSTDEFPFQAPTEGYKATIDIDQATIKPPTWDGLYQGGSFYVKTSSGYGRIELEMIPRKTWMRVKYWLNPTAGSRNLEYTPEK